MTIWEIILLRMLVPFFITYVVSTFAYSLLLQFRIFKKKCNGTWLVNGCNKTLYPYIYKNLLYAMFIRNNYITILQFFNKHEKIKKMFSDKKYSIQYITIRYWESDPNFERVRKHLCNDCNEKHEAIVIANLLAEE